MPPKNRYKKEDIISAAIDIIRAEGIKGVTARNIAKKMNASTKVIFTYFSDMAELEKNVMEEIERIYNRCIFSGMQNTKIPPYKSSGLAYINFARTEPELFKILFMRDRKNEEIFDEREKIRPIIELIKKNTGLSEEESYNFHLQLWIYVHGIATMIATSFLEWDDEFIDKTLTNAYQGLKMCYCKENKKDEQH